MLNRRPIGLLVAVVLGATVCLVGTTSVLGVCTQITHHAQPVAATVVYCAGPGACIPMSPWGYYQRQWQPWPGSQYRQDVVFPQSLGVERLSTPRGERPKPLPREKYGKRIRKRDLDAQESAPLHIGEGAALEPLETPVPFDYLPQVESP